MEQEKGYGNYKKQLTAKRLRELRGKTSYEKLSENIGKKFPDGISADSLKIYEISNPKHKKYNNGFGMKISNLFQLAEYYGVSTDFLLGRTEIKTDNIEEASDCKYVQLSEDAIEALNEFSKTDNGKAGLKILSYLIGNNSVFDFLTELINGIIAVRVYDFITDFKDPNKDEERNRILWNLNKLYMEKCKKVLDEIIDTPKFDKELSDVEQERIPQAKEISKEIMKTAGKFLQYPNYDINEIILNHLKKANEAKETIQYFLGE